MIEVTENLRLLINELESSGYTPDFVVSVEPTLFTLQSFLERLRADYSRLEDISLKQLIFETQFNTRANQRFIENTFG